jgi:hypothetical protein
LPVHKNAENFCTEIHEELFAPPSLTRAGLEQRGAIIPFKTGFLQSNFFLEMVLLVILRTDASHRRWYSGYRHARAGRVQGSGGFIFPDISGQATIPGSTLAPLT